MGYKAKVKARITENRELASGIYRLILADPPGTGGVQAIAQVAKPGQFVNLYLNSRTMLLPRPFGISDIVRAEDSSTEIALVYAVAGEGTSTLSGYAPGTEVEILAPQGNGYDLANLGRHVLLIGGGLGIPPLVFAARKIRENPDTKNVRITALLGYRDKKYISFALEIHCDEVFDITDREGTVMDLIARLEGSGTLVIPSEPKGDFLFLDQSIKADLSSQFNAGTTPLPVPGTIALSCGPMPMLKAVAQWSVARGIPTQLSLEERMGCGYGACVGCTIETKVYHNGLLVNERKKVCKDGPVFPADVVQLP